MFPVSRQGSHRESGKVQAVLLCFINMVGKKGLPQDLIVLKLIFDCSSFEKQAQTHAHAHAHAHEQAQAQAQAQVQTRHTQRIHTHTVTGVVVLTKTNITANALAVRSTYSNPFIISSSSSRQQQQHHRRGGGGLNFQKKIHALLKNLGLGRLPYPCVLLFHDKTTF
jgi:hypothetical protein